MKNIRKQLHRKGKSKRRNGKSSAPAPSESPAHYPRKKKVHHAARLLAATNKIKQNIDSQLADFEASMKEQAKLRNSAPRELQREEALKILKNCY